MRLQFYFVVCTVFNLESYVSYRGDRVSTGPNNGTSCVVQSCKDVVPKICSQMLELGDLQGGALTGVDAGRAAEVLHCSSKQVRRVSSTLCPRKVNALYSRVVFARV